VRACIRPHKRDEGKSNSEVGSRDPIVRFYGALFAGLNGQTEHRGLELSSEHNPNPSSSCIAKGQFGNGRLWEYSPLAGNKGSDVTCCFALLCYLIYDTSAKENHTGPLWGSIAARPSVIIHVCNISLQQQACC
jgi:hypothetical protein